MVYFTLECVGWYGGTEYVWTYICMYAYTEYWWLRVRRVRPPDEGFRPRKRTANFVMWVARPSVLEPDSAYFRSNISVRHPPTFQNCMFRTYVETDVYT